MVHDYSSQDLWARAQTTYAYSPDEFMYRHASIDCRMLAPTGNVACWLPRYSVYEYVLVYVLVARAARFAVEILTTSVLIPAAHSIFTTDFSLRKGYLRGKH
jgi:hypothetical protein